MKEKMIKLNKNKLGISKYNQVSVRLSRASVKKNENDLHKMNFAQQQAYIYN